MNSKYSDRKYLTPVNDYDNQDSSDQSEEYQELDTPPISELSDSCHPKCKQSLQKPSSTVSPKFLQFQRQQQISIQPKSQKSPQKTEKSSQTNLESELYNQLQQFKQQSRFQIQKLVNQNNRLLQKNEELTAIIKSQNQILQEQQKILGEAEVQSEKHQERQRQLQERISQIMSRVFGKQNAIKDMKEISQKLDKELSQINKLDTLMNELNRTLNSSSQGKDKKNAINKTHKLGHFYLTELVEKLQKIQVDIYRLQSQTTAYRQYISRLQKELQTVRQNQKGGMKKWLNPVLKFCKIEEEEDKRRRPEQNQRPMNKKIKLKDNDDCDDIDFVL